MEGIAYRTLLRPIIYLALAAASLFYINLFPPSAFSDAEPAGSDAPPQFVQALEYTPDEPLDGALRVRYNAAKRLTGERKAQAAALNPEDASQGAQGESAENPPEFTLTVSSGETAGDPGAYLVAVNRRTNNVTVYARDGGGEFTVPVRAMVCSTGAATPLGTYYTSDKYEWRALFGGVYGQYATRITGSILFHSVPYKYMDKSTLKYEEYNKLGQSASMGCVRLSAADAKWIYDNCAAGTAVMIYEDDWTGPLGKPEALKIDGESAWRGWDPTDPDAANPWNAG